MGKISRYLAAVYLALLGYVIFADSLSKLKSPEQFGIQALFVLNIIYFLISLIIFYSVFALVKNLRKMFPKIIVLLAMFYVFYIGQQVIWNELAQAPSSELASSALSWLIIYSIPIALVLWSLRTETVRSSKNK